MICKTNSYLYERIHKCQSQSCLSDPSVNMEETVSTQFITETMQKVSRSNSLVSLKSLTTLSHGQSMSQVLIASHSSILLNTLFHWSQVINLHQFARDGDLVRLSETLESETLREKVNELDVKENTPLHYACRQNC